MEQETSIEVESTTVACDGGGGSLGHPKVYLNLGAELESVCPYCSRHFVLAEGAVTGSGH